MHATTMDAIALMKLAKDTVALFQQTSNAKALKPSPEVTLPEASPDPFVLISPPTPPPSPLLLPDPTGAFEASPLPDATSMAANKEPPLAAFDSPDPFVLVVPSHT